MELSGYIEKTANFSAKTFGNGYRTTGICEHIRQELEEIRENPNDLFEWVDVIILALDGATNRGFTPKQITEALEVKLAVNICRNWPSIAEQEEGKPINHIKN